MGSEKERKQKTERKKEIKEKATLTGVFEM